MNLHRHGSLGILLTLSIAMITSGQSPKPPIAKQQPKVLEEHGDERIDPYFWMRERENPEVISYLEAENTYLDAALRDTSALQEKLYEECIARIKQDDTTVPYRDNGYIYFKRFEEGQQYGIFCRRKDKPNATDEVMLDVNKLANGHAFCSVFGVKVNETNDLVAFSIDTVGRRLFSIRVKDLRTGDMLDVNIPNVSGNFVWAKDGKTIFYTRQDPQTLRWYQVFRHTLGTDPDDDVLVFEEKDDTFRCSLRRSRSREYIFIDSQQTLSSESRYLDAAQPKGEFQVVIPRRRDHEYSVDHLGEHFYIRTNDDAQNFRLVKTPVSSTQKNDWEELIPHRAQVLLQNFNLFEDYLVVQERRDGLTRLRILPWSGQEEHEVDFGEPAYFAFTAPTPDVDSSVLRYAYTSLTTPWSTFDYDMKTREKKLLKQQPVLGDFDRSNYQTERVLATVRDGAKVPITFVYRKGFERDGKSPCLLQGYGSYGATEDPMFQSELFNLIDRGFVFAIAHIRGGQIYGRPWYEDGKLLNKKNTFYDFIDCGEFLIQEKIADPNRLFAKGGSAGGLLMGAVINMQPELFKGVIAGVPFVDVLTTMLDDSIPLTTAEYDEWGNPHEKKYYDYIKSYSPYDNVTPQPYPHLLVTSGLHDSQVQYWEPTKWVAKLRAAKTNDNLVLLKTNMDAGHGGASGRFERFKMVSLQHAFLLHLAGIDE